MVNDLSMTITSTTPAPRKSIFAKGIKTSYNRGMGKQKIVEYFEEVEASQYTADIFAVFWKRLV